VDVWLLSPFVIENPYDLQCAPDFGKEMKSKQEYASQMLFQLDKWILMSE
jgi:hypothetical protein